MDFVDEVDTDETWPAGKERFRYVQLPLACLAKIQRFNFLFQVQESRIKASISGVKLLVFIPLLLCTVVVAASPEDPRLHYYWPRFARAATVLTVTEVPSREMAVVLDTLSGLAARAVRDRGGSEMIWAPLNHPSYLRWFQMMTQHTGARIEGPYSIWDLVKRFQERGVVKGYILYHYDTSSRGFFEKGPMDASVNPATSLCAFHDAIALADTLEENAKALGLRLLLDARGMTEAECYAQFHTRFNRSIIALQDPKANEIRSEAVALGAFVLSRPGDLYERALSGLKRDTPVLGWAIGDEMEITKPATLWGHFQTATNWCHDLPLLSTEKPGATYPRARLQQPQRRTLWDLSWEDDVHYVSFIMSDGDNVQWLMGDFVEDQYKGYWSNPNRGTVPIGWTCCYIDLAQLCPYALDYLFRTATPQDDFVLYGGGYFYPDLFGARWPKSDVMRMHARRIGAYMGFGGIRLLAFNAEDWDSPEAIGAYTKCAEEIPDLLGMFTVQYAPYTAGGGAIKWAPNRRGREVPVVSAQFSIWANTNTPRDAGPTITAQRLNASPHEGPANTEDHFSWVVVHAWSWFKEPQKDAVPGAEEIEQAQGGQAGTGRGLFAERWCVDALEPHVRVVTPTELALLLRLHLRPKETLEDGLGALAQQVRRGANTLQVQLKDAREKLRAGDYRASFDLGREIAAMLKDADRL